MGIAVFDVNVVIAIAVVAAVVFRQHSFKLVMLSTALKARKVRVENVGKVLPFFQVKGKLQIENQNWKR